jgi:hypothetical protein
MYNQQKIKKVLLVCLTTLVIFGIVSLYLASADPQGATITGSPYVDSGANTTAGSRTDGGGKIISLSLSLQQQDSAWKAYVGNVTGNYVLKNSNNYSIYQWPLGSSIIGEVYISRNSSLNFSNGAITCANSTHLTNEGNVLGMTASATDSLNSTFNGTNHTTFNVGTNVIAQNTCKAISLWVNNTAQSQSNSSIFQEVALYDGINLVYTSIINYHKTGFDNTTTYDFQSIIADNRSSSTGTPYYFFVELG